MGFRAETRYQDDASIRPHSPSGERERMSNWRRLLYAVMERFELREDAYLGIPNAKIIRRDVPLTGYTGQESSSLSPPGEGLRASAQEDVTRARRDNAPALATLASWIQEIRRRGSQTR
jgi:hypothetical protein